jgi:hypothetical protein
MTETLEKSDWRAFFERMTKALEGRRAEIEIASLKLGHQNRGRVAALARHVV